MLYKVFRKMCFFFFLLLFKVGLYYFIIFFMHFVFWLDFFSPGGKRLVSHILIFWHFSLLAKWLVFQMKQILSFVVVEMPLLSRQDWLILRRWKFISKRKTLLPQIIITRCDFEKCWKYFHEIYNFKL